MQGYNSAFDLNAMMYAIPLRGMRAECYIDRIPNETLAYIFDYVRSRPEPLMKEPLTLSHVCRRWRSIINTTTWQWTYLTLSNPVSHSEMFADFVSRSRHRPYSLNINLPSFDLDLYQKEQQNEFKKTFAILRKNVSRLKILNIVSNNPTLWTIFNKILKGVDAPLLESLRIHQVNPEAKRYTLAALNFNPAVFWKLTLLNVTVDADAPRFAGVHSLHLVNSAGSLLDQRQLRHSTYPAIPHQPVMMHLQQLLIDGTNMILTDELYAPSFLGSSLLYLLLKNISIYDNDSREATRRLFQVTYGPQLRELIIWNLDTESFQQFILLTISSPGIRYPHVQGLALYNVDFGDVPDLFLQAFPQVTELTLYGPRHELILGFLRDRTIMPLLLEIDVEGQLRPRT
ncbi:hypothetical protein H0H92_006065 [Tricholoma furcatifolium]|nr:hypothetical protein H0H92_006065 [Tricholoma furcatifolium]